MILFVVVLPRSMMYSTTTFVIFWPPTTLPYQAYLGAIGTDDAIGSFQKGSYSRGQVMYLVLVEGSSRLVA